MATERTSPRRCPTPLVGRRSRSQASDFLAIDVGHSWCNSSGIAGEVIGALVEAIILEPDGVNTDSPLRGGRLTRRANSSPTRQWCALVQLIISSDRTFTVVSLGERLH